jgi:hypothetical protein
MSEDFDEDELENILQQEDSIESEKSEELSLSNEDEVRSMEDLANNQRKHGSEGPR